MRISKFKRVDLLSSREVHFHEHEVLMSFYDDSGCEAFHEWWNIEGTLVFNEWLKMFKEYQHLANKEADIMFDNEPVNEIVTLTKKEYKELLTAEKKLIALECGE